MNTPNDSLILDEYLYRVSKNDRDALEEIYHLTNKNVFGFALSIVSNYHDAEDIMQDTYVNIFKHANIYRSTGKPLAWILTITKNISYNKLKSLKNKNCILTEDMDLINGKIDNPDDRLLIETILKDLTSEERQIIILHELNGFKYNEISQILELNISTILSKYHRAIKKIRSQYGKEM